MLSIVGSISGTIISIIVPVMLFNKAYEHSEKKQKTRKFNMIFMGIGCIFGTIGFI